MFEKKTLYSPQLGRSVNLYIFVPDDCCATSPCPVLYLNDGELYYGKSSCANESGSICFGEYYRTYHQYLPRILIVGIEPPLGRRARTAELSPYTKAFDTHGADFDLIVHGRGKELAEWIVCNLKPFVDRTYATLRDQQYTAIGGFSSGALNAMYCVMAYGNIFGRLMMHSPAFNLWTDKLEESLRSANFQSLLSCYMDVGTNDFTRMTTKEEMLSSAYWMRSQMISHGMVAGRLRFFVIPDGQHSPATWRWTFPDALRWIFKDC